MSDFQFNPTDGYNNKIAFPTKPASESEFRATMQTLLNQIRDYMNTNMVRPDHDNNFTAPQTINGNLKVVGNDITMSVPGGGDGNLFFSYDGNARGILSFSGAGGNFFMRNLLANGSLAGTLAIGDDSKLRYNGNEVWNNGNSPSSKATNGYQQFGSGMMIQGGTASIPQGVSTSITFPLAFPTSCIAAIPVIDTPAAFAISTAGQTRTQFYVIQSSGATRDVKWIAFGY